MASAANDPRLLYSVNNIRAFHIQDGEGQDLTPSGPQTLSLLMVPTNTATAGPGTDWPEDSLEEDFYLHLYLPPELDIAIPATTQIFHQPPDSYLIPRWDMGPDVGAFIRIQFPSIGKGPKNVSQDDVDTFESILAQCTAFLERTPHPKAQDYAAYNPADYAPGEGYVGTPDTKKADAHGRIVLVDEENGSVVGELGDGYNVVEDADVKPGSKSKHGIMNTFNRRVTNVSRTGPVGIELPAEGGGNQVSVSNVSEEYLAMARHPAYKKSTLVQTSATASRLIVTGSTYLASAIASGAESFQKKTQPNVKPLKFSDATHARIRKVGSFSNGAADISARTVGQVGRVAQNIGASLARKQESGRKKGIDRRNPPPDYKPGVLNKSMIAFSTLADGIEQSARNMLFSGAGAASSMIEHRYGNEAGSVATNLTGGIKNVGLVYIDVTGVSRRALLKSVAKGMVVGKMRNGQQVVVGGGDGGQVPANAVESASGPSGLSARDPVVRRASPNPTPPPAYGASGTTSLNASSM
ncbi:Senescence/spartin-associated [Penicillium italicum]|uniref:Senescence/spartin-associated n=1 Tax=Penicillium italicum TaxID=40296 RepID=A0A0A2L4K1_PENIT|nr:Senescence/spartin-associated [Penicillium italicum]